MQYLEKFKKLKKWQKALVVFIAVYLLAIILDDVSRENGPWYGRIVDAETKEPLAGAVVIARWVRSYPSVGGEVDYFRKAREVVTDQDGYFKIHSYHTINTVPFIFPIRGPVLTVYYPGHLSIDRITAAFLVKGATNEVLSSIFRVESVTKEIIELKKKSKDRSYEYTYRLGPNRIELPRLISSEDRRKFLVSRPSIPERYLVELTKALDKERLYLGLKPFTSPEGNREP